MIKISKWPYYTLITIAILLWILLRLFQPDRPDSNPYGLSKTAIIVLSATLFVPYFLTWALAIKSSYMFKKITVVGVHRKWPYARGFDFIASGVSLLAADLICTALLNSARNVYIREHTPAMTLTIISNLVHMVLPLLAFIFFYMASKELLNRSRYAMDFKTHVITLLVPVIIFTSFFSLLVFSSSMRQFPGGPGELATYYLPDILILLLIVVPLTTTWFIGLKAALNVERFTHSLNNPALRKTMIRFYNGLIALIGSSIILQGLTALGSERLENLGLLPILILVYLWVIVQMLAFVFLSNCASKIIKEINRTHSEINSESKK